MNDEKKEKPYFLRRIGAYLIDIIVVTLLASAISMVFFDNTKSQGYTKELTELAKKCSNNELTAEECEKQSNDLNYNFAVDSVEITIVNCAVALVYYVILCYFCHGITLGKYLMRIRIVSANENELNMGNYLIRALFVNLILSNMFSVICVYTMNKETFNNIHTKGSNILSIFLLVTMLFMMYRQDGRGLHDLMSNTKIISTKEPKNKEKNEESNEENNNKIVEAKVIEEKKITKKSTKKKTKKEVKK